MNLAIAIPLKPLHLAKTRLRPGLDDAERQQLVVRMLTHVLRTVQASHVASACSIISADPQALALARAFHCTPIAEPAPSGYNEAIVRASDWALAHHHDALLILPADLPFITPEDIQTLARLAAPHPRCVIIAPDAAETGTNALLLRPPDIITPSFGPDSFQQHQQNAITAGVTPIIHRAATLAQDIDWPQDLQQLAPLTDLPS